MVKKVVWTQRVRAKDKEIIDSILEAYMVAKGLDSKGDALVHFIKNRAHIDEGSDSEALIPEIRYPGEAEFEAICPFGYLKRLSVNYKDEKYYCLKQQGPNRTGKPVLLADGDDKQSIKAICEVCQVNWQTGSRNIDQVRLVFKELGDKEVSSNVYFCIRDAVGEGVKLSPTEKGRFFCIERNRKVTIQNTCIPKACPYLVQKVITLFLGETLPFIDAQKTLEVLE